MTHSTVIVGSRVLSFLLRERELAELDAMDSPTAITVSSGAE